MYICTRECQLLYGLLGVLRLRGLMKSTAPPGKTVTQRFKYQKFEGFWCQKPQRLATTEPRKDLLGGA